ncbi:hypothetical protein ES703_93974 [subsurface metagenome]
MAKFWPGPLVAEIRGSVGGTTFTRGRYGLVARVRAKPTVSVTDEATAAKARMTAATQLWQTMSAGERLAWNQWANGNPVAGALGESQILTGHVASVGVNCRRDVFGEAMTNIPPITPAPAALTAMSFVASKTEEKVNIAYDVSPLGAEEVLYVQACQYASAGKVWVENLFKGQIQSGLAEASSWSAFTNVEARIGELVIGYMLHLKVFVAHPANGLLSAPLRSSMVIV